MPAMKVKGTAGYRKNRVDDEVVLVHPLPEERSGVLSDRCAALRCCAMDGQTGSCFAALFLRVPEKAWVEARHVASG